MVDLSKIFLISFMSLLIVNNFSLGSNTALDPLACLQNHPSPNIGNG